MHGSWSVGKNFRSDLGKNIVSRDNFSSIFTSFPQNPAQSPG